MDNSSPSSKTTLADLQSRIKDQVARFEELRGFL